MIESLKALNKDKRFALLIAKYGTPDLKQGRNPFQAFVRSIISQQLSTKAAGTIRDRFLTLYARKGSKKGRFPTPQEVLATSVEQMRGVGLSNQKATYLHDLALKFSDGTIKHKLLHKMGSAEIVEHLIQVKGIGVWSVHMFLIFSLNRPDVLPTGDLGVRKGMQVVYGLRDLPSPTKMELLAVPWRAHASTAAWYFWRVADDAKEKKSK